MIYVYQGLTPRVQWLGQAPATEASVQEGFSHTEQILLVSVVLSAIGIVIRLWELNHGK